MESSDERTEAQSRDSERPNSKVARLIERYDLGDLGKELELSWTTEGEERRSLRELADYFNQQLLRANITGERAQPVEGEIENLYQLLTADETSEASKKRAQRQLQREGIDVESLQSNFVTYQAIRSYLQDYRGAEYSKSQRNRTTSTKEDIQQLKGRLERVAESKLNRLQRSDDIQISSVSVLVDTAVICEDCGSQYTVDELLEDKACECFD